VKVYVLTDGRYEQEVAGVFTTAEAAMAERPHLNWEMMSAEDFPDGFWVSDNYDRSRVFGFDLQGPGVRELTLDDIKAGRVQVASYSRKAP
jgi:hypothetical protein